MFVSVPGPMAEIRDVESSSGDDFNWNSTLPAGWEETKDEMGVACYKNFISNEIQYQHPVTGAPVYFP